MKSVYKITVETKHVMRTLTALSVSEEDALSENQSWLIEVCGKVIKVEKLEPLPPLSPLTVDIGSINEYGLTQRVIIIE